MAWLTACNNTNEQSVDPDEESIRSLLDSLKTDTLVISVENVGCEPLLNEELNFFKVNCSLYAELAIVSSDKKTLKQLISPLTNESFIAYRKFETEGKRFKNDGPPSTLKTTYKILLKSDTIIFEDYRQQFDFYWQLKKAIFGVQTIENLRREVYR